MHFKLSKQARIIIVFNIILSLSVAVFSGDRIIKMTKNKTRLKV